MVPRNDGIIYVHIPPSCGFVQLQELPPPNLLPSTLANEGQEEEREEG